MSALKINRALGLDGLTRIIQARVNEGPVQVWETIAAFNCEPAADAYIRDCRKTNGRLFSYRKRAIGPERRA